MWVAQWLLVQKIKLTGQILIPAKAVAFTLQKFPWKMARIPFFSTHLPLSYNRMWSQGFCIVKPLIISHVVSQLNPCKGSSSLLSDTIKPISSPH